MAEFCLSSNLKYLFNSENSTNFDALIRVRRPNPLFCIESPTIHGGAAVWAGIRASKPFDQTERIVDLLVQLVDHI